MSSARLTVRDMARGLPVGGSRSGELCPKCQGGQSGERSLSVYRNEWGVGARCHRASCGLNIFRGSPEISLPNAPPAFKPRPYPFPLAAPLRVNEVWDRLRVPAAERGPALAARLGLHAREGVSNEIVWEVRGYDWAARGHVSRTYPDKRIRVWRESNTPFYAYHGFRRTPTLWIVEDSVSAAQIALAGGNALALLGVQFSLAGQQELGDYLARLKTVAGTPQIKVALDPDAATVAVKLTRELTSRLGYATMFMPLVADPKDLPEGELARMVEER